MTKLRMDVYAFKRKVPLTTGPVGDRSRYYVYAYSKEEAIAKYKEQNPTILEDPEFIGRTRA